MFKVKWLPKAKIDYDGLKEAGLQTHESRKRSGKKKSSKAEGLFKQVHKAIELLSSNPKHPGLQTHMYITLEHPYDRSQKVFVAYPQNRTPGAYRVFWCYGPGKQEITILAITPRPAPDGTGRQDSPPTRN